MTNAVKHSGKSSAILASIHGMNVSFRMAAILIAVGLVGIILYVKESRTKEKSINLGKYAVEQNE